MVAIGRKMMMLIEMKNAPIGGCLRAIFSETARSDCTLLINEKVSQTLRARIAFNDIDYRRAA
jgi:hypothetical protein